MAYFFANSKYVYIGSTKREPAQRFAEHQHEVDVGMQHFKHRVWRKHGVRAFVVFKQVATEQTRIQLEQAYYDFFASHGWQLVNDCRPDMSKCDNYNFTARTEYRQMLSDAQKRRYERPEELQVIHTRLQDANYIQRLRDSNKLAWSNAELRKRHSALCKAIMARPEIRQALSERSKSYWQRPEFRKKQCERLREFASSEKQRQRLSDAQKASWQEHREERLAIANSYDNRMKLSEAQLEYLSTAERCHKRSAHLNCKEVNDKRKLAYATDAYRNKRKAAFAFRRQYATTNVRRFKYKTGKFEPWMSFIIQPDDNVIVFVWDTRKVLFQCKKEDLPDGYVKTWDSCMLLQF